MLYGEIITVYSDNYMKHIKVGKNKKIQCVIRQVVYTAHLPQHCHNSKFVIF
jgi:hypothetical protein